MLDATDAQIAKHLAILAPLFLGMLAGKGGDDQLAAMHAFRDLLEDRATSFLVLVAPMMNNDPFAFWGVACSGTLGSSGLRLERRRRGLVATRSSPLAVRALSSISPTRAMV